MADQGQPLQTLFAEFDQKGADQLYKGFADLKKASEALTDQFNKAGGLLKDQMGKLTEATQKGAKEIGKAAGEATQKTGALGQMLQSVSGRATPSFMSVAGAIGVANLSIAGLIGSGFAASSMGERLGWVMERLALTVAGLFTPELMAVTNLLNDFTVKLQNMTPAQRQHIAYTLQAVAATKLMYGAVSSLLPVLGPVGALLLAMGVGGMVSREGLGGLLQEMRPLAEAARSVASIMTSVLIPAAQSLAVILDTIGPFIKAIAEAVKELSGPIGPGKQGGGKLAGRVAVGAAGGATIGSIVPGIGTGLGAILGAAGAYITGVLGSEAEKAPVKGYRGPMVGRGGGFEDIGAAYGRIAQLAIRASAMRTIEEEHRDISKDMYNLLLDFSRKFPGLIPWVKPSR